MSDQKDRTASRRKVLQHTGAATAAVASIPNIGSAVESSETTRLIEAVIQYDVNDELSENEELDLWHNCPGGGYHVEEGNVHVYPSSTEEEIRAVFKNHPQVVNFGELKPLDTGKLGGRHPIAITQRTSNDTLPYMDLKLSDESDYKTPNFTIVP